MRLVMPYAVFFSVLNHAPSITGEHPSYVREKYEENGTIGKKRCNLSKFLFVWEKVRNDYGDEASAASSIIKSESIELPKNSFVIVTMRTDLEIFPKVKNIYLRS